MLFRWPVILLLLPLFILPHPVMADSLPRMVSLRADEVNVRAGPGRRYPIKWVFHRRGLPVEVIEENGLWRRIRDWEGGEGWVIRSLLSEQRTILVLRGEPALHGQPQVRSPVFARLTAGMTARVQQCSPDWCRVTVEHLEGWIRRDCLWGLRADELIE